MRISFSKLVVAAVLVFLSCICVSAQSQLTNPGFESGLVGWAIAKSGTGGAFSGSGSAHSGSGYAQLEASVFTAILIADSSGTATYIEVNQGDVVTYGGWVVKDAGDGVARWSLKVTDENLGNPQFYPLGTAGSSWGQQQGTYTVPAGVKFVRLYAEIHKMTTNTRARFDDAVFSIQRVGGAPAVTSVSPNSGPTSGGTSVTVSGSGFVTGATLTFGGTPATSVNVSSSSILTGVTPAQPTGTVDIAVRNPDGQTGSLAGAFTYQNNAPPAPTQLTATAVAFDRIDLGWTDNSTNESGFYVEVSTNGSNFTQIASLPADTTAYSHTGLAASTQYYYRVRAHNGNGGSAYSNTASATTAAATSPATSPLTNPGFESGTAGWAIIRSGTVTVPSDSKLSHSGSRYARVSSLAYAGLRAADGNGAPAYFEVAEGDEVRFGGWALRESGDGIVRWAIEVTDAQKANPSYVTFPGATNAWSLQDKVYRVPAGKKYVRFYCEVYKSTVTTTARFDDAIFEITRAQGTPAPTLSGVNPNSGPAAGGTVVDITGAGFLSGADASFGGALASDATVLDGNRIRATAPAHSAGTVDVVVVNPDGQSGTLAGGFTYTSGTSTADLSKIKHIIVFMQENRSFDNYFGRMGQYRRDRGFTDPFDELPLNVELVDRAGHKIKPFHFQTVCHEGLSPGWNSSHYNYNGGKMDNFAKTWIASDIDPDGTRAMGYYDWTDLPYYYELAFQYATSDRFFASLLSGTNPNRMYMFAATSFGHEDPDPAPEGGWPQPTIFDRLSSAGVSWRYYYQDNIKYLASWQTWQRDKEKAFPISQYYVDVQNEATLPSVIFIERAGTTGLDEHPRSNIQKGAANTKKIIDALMNSPSWASSVFILLFDEAGGLYDHVPPPPMPKPDNISPILEPGDPVHEFDRAGFRVPLIVISPYVKRHFVSHRPREITSVLKLIETRFGVAPLTNRDAAADDMTEFFDFSSPPRLAIPSLPNQPTNKICDFNLQKAPGHD